MTYIEEPITVSSQIQAILSQYGLESMGNWVLDQIRIGRNSVQIMQDLWQQPTFQARFPGIFERQALGLPPISPGEYVEYERRAAQVMRDAGLPPGFYDQSEDFHRLITKDVSLPELQSRIDDGYLRVAGSTQEVRDVFAEFYGVSGDSALAAYYIDPDRAKPALMKQAAASFFSGTGRRFGINADQATAERAAQVGVTSDQAAQGFEQLQTLSPVFTETITENEDLDIEDQGVAATFGLGGPGSAQVAARRARREADMSGYGGGPANTPSGAKGLGSSERTRR